MSQTMREIETENPEFKNLVLTPENQKTWIGVLAEIFDKICKLDLVEYNYLNKRIEEAKKAGKDGLEWSYSPVEKMLGFTHKACFKGILGGLKGYRQVKHLEIDMQSMLNAAKAQTLPGYEKLMLEVVQASKLYREICKKYGDYEPTLKATLNENGMTSCRIILFFKASSEVEALMLEGKADIEVLKTA